MPRIGAEPERRQSLIDAAIHVIGEHGSLDVSVRRIADRAGMSPALAFHYFGGKEQIVIAAMRQVLAAFAAEVRSELKKAQTPLARAHAIIRASFSTTSFQPEVISAWLNFYVLARTSPDAARLLGIYHRRLHSNLVHALGPLAGEASDKAAEMLGALIDGIYLRQVLANRPLDRTRAIAMVQLELDRYLSGATP